MAVPMSTSHVAALFGLDSGDASALDLASEALTGVVGAVDGELPWLSQRPEIFQLLK